MSEFIKDNFLLSNNVSKKLYQDYARTIPIIDYHCHISPKEIAEDKTFETISELWLGGDHYKWRLMRANGIEERYITGDALPWEKFKKWAETLERSIGNPLYHWSHLELKRYFDYDGVLNGDTAKEVWELCNQKIKTDKLSARKLIKMSNVEVIGTTDDPIDDLKWHQLLSKDASFQTRVLPMWRPDKAISIEKEGFIEYLELLSKASGLKIKTYQELKQSLKLRMDYFELNGCTGSDHGLLYVPYEPASDEILETIFSKKLKGENISTLEAMQFKTACLLFLGREYAKRKWVMQLHIGVSRDNNQGMYDAIGPDTGFDSVYNQVPLEQLSKFLNLLNIEHKLPRTIIYSLNPNDNTAIGSLLGCFQESGTRGKMQHGAAWWFNDHEAGIREQMISFANLGVLGNFIGMLTDSRSFLSYTRHEYFRRILCDLMGTWIESGRYPNDINKVGELIQNICYQNVKEYFNF